MHNFKRKTALFLALLILFPFLFSGRAGSVSIEENIPTIFIDNDAWYKYQISPLKKVGDELCIPISVFAAFDFLTVTEDKAAGCFLISSRDGKFLSVSIQSSRYLTHEGKPGDITVTKDDREYYISAEKSAEALGIKTEKAFFYDKDIIRLYAEEELTSLEVLIDFYVVYPNMLQGGPGFGTGTGKHRDTVSAIADISDLGNEEFESLTNLINELGITVTYGVDKAFVKNKKNIPFIIKAAAEGHAFVISVKNTKFDTDIVRDIKECDLLLSRIIHKKTMAVIGTTERTDIIDSGYTVLANTERISNITGIDNLDFKKTNLIEFDIVNQLNLSKIMAIVFKAKLGGIDFYAIDHLCGK